MKTVVYSFLLLLFYCFIYLFFGGGGSEKRYLDESCDWVQVLQELALAWSTVFGGYAQKNVPLDMS